MGHAPGKKVRKLHGGSLTYPCLIPSLSTSVSLLYPTCIHASIYFFIYYPPTQSTFKSLKKKWAKNLPQHWRHGINYQQLMYRNKFYLMEGGILENSATNSLFYHQSLFHILINIALGRLKQPQIFLDIWNIKQLQDILKYHQEKKLGNSMGVP